MTKQTFIGGTLILLAAGIINRILGFIPRIALPRVIGAEGIGLYQMGYPFLIVVITFITGGIPLAVSKLVAEAEAERNETRVRSILKISMGLTLGLSFLFTSICLIGARWLTEHLFTDDRVYLTFLCMSPIILFAGISSVFRGYFQGRHNMIPTALSGVVETIARIIMMLVFSFLLLPYGIEYAAAGAMIGVVVGEISGMLVLLTQYRLSKKGVPGRSRASIGTTKTKGRLTNFKKIINIAVPVTGGKLVGSGSYFLESVFIVQSLAIAGVATKLATAQYGMLQGMIIPIVLLPTALTYSLAVSLVPALSEAAARKDMQTIHNRLHQSLKLSLVTGAPFVVLMYILAEPLCMMLYNQTGTLVTMLKMLAPIALFIYFQAPLQSALQALDRPGTALINTFVGSAVKLSLILWLVRKPEVGILGAVLAICINIGLVTLLHWISVTRLTKFSMNSTDVLKVVLSMAVTGLCSYGVTLLDWTKSNGLQFLTAGLLGLAVYIFMIVLLKLVDINDFRRIHFFLSRKIRPR